MCRAVERALVIAFYYDSFDTWISPHFFKLLYVIRLPLNKSGATPSNAEATFFRSAKAQRYPCDLRVVDREWVLCLHPQISLPPISLATI